MPTLRWERIQKLLADDNDPQDGEVTTWNATTKSWENRLASGVGTPGPAVTHQLAATGTLSGASSIGDMAATLSGVSSGMPATASYPVLGGGLLITGANTGTATFYFRSETTAVTTCKSGSVILVVKV